MKRTKLRLALCIGMTVLLLGFIWGNSALPAEESGGLSGGLLEFLARFLPFLRGEGGEHFLRKAAHFSEFAALGLCLAWLFGMLRGRLLPAVLCGMAAACVDECIQIFSPGRASSLWDVALDSTGVVTGVLVLFLLLLYRRRKIAPPEC